MYSPTPAARALCLLLVVVVTIVGAASAAGGVDKNSKKTTTLPGSCLMAASTLCADADTNAMRCLRKLAFLGDVRVPKACADAIMAGVTMNPRLKQASRTQQLARMLVEGGNCAAGNSCAGTLGGQNDQLCNAVISQSLRGALCTVLDHVSAAISLTPCANQKQKQKTLLWLLCVAAGCSCRAHRWLRRLLQGHLHGPLQLQRLAHHVWGQHRRLQLQQHMLQQF